MHFDTRIICGRKYKSFLSDAISTDTLCRMGDRSIDRTTRRDHNNLEDTNPISQTQSDRTLMVSLKEKRVHCSKIDFTRLKRIMIQALCCFCASFRQHVSNIRLSPDMLKNQSFVSHVRTKTVIVANKIPFLWFFKTARIRPNVTGISKDDGSTGVLESAQFNKKARHVLCQTGRRANSQQLGSLSTLRLPVLCLKDFLFCAADFHKIDTSDFLLSNHGSASDA